LSGKGDFSAGKRACFLLPNDLVSASRLRLRSNHQFLHDLGVRPCPRISTEDLTLFTRGHCLAFTEALRLRPDRVDCRPAIIAEAAAPDGEIDARGGFHSALLLADGRIEDAWGIGSIDRVARRYGLSNWVLRTDRYDDVLADWRKTSGSVLADRLIWEAAGLMSTGWERT
jgi:hypothetical protein